MTDFKDSVNPASTYVTPATTYLPNQPMFVAPQPTYLPQQPMNVSITNQPQATTLYRPVGPKSMYYICPSCEAVIKTSIKKRSTAKTHLSALLLCLVGCWLCCLCPYCMNDCLTIEHYCPNCQAYLGNYVI